MNVICACGKEMTRIMGNKTESLFGCPDCEALAIINADVEKPRFYLPVEEDDPGFQSRKVTAGKRMWERQKNQIVGRLPTRITNALARSYFRGELTKPLADVSDEDLLILPDIGQLSLKLIRDILYKGE